MEPSSAIPTSTQNNATVDAKILADLNVVREKIGVLESMLRPGDGSPNPSVKNHEALLGVIGFLEACAPRMIELVEAGALGAISGEVLEKCLDVNDQLMKLLADVDTMALTETAASTTAASAPIPNAGFEDLSLDEENESQNFSAPAVTGKSTGEEDPDFFNPKAPPPTSAPPAPKDDFDFFLEERTSGANKSEG